MASDIYSRSKGFDYPQPSDALRAYKNYPDLPALAEIAKKMIDADGPALPGRDLFQAGGRRYRGS